MSKPKKKGLPDSFELNIPDSMTERPVELGDYLDELAQRVEPPKKKKQAPMPSEENIVDLPVKANKNSPQPKPKKFPRKQINMNHQTIEMVDSLVRYVQTYGVQKDARASEIFEALVLALHEAKEFIDLSQVPPRGRWGTPTAEAFPLALKSAFQEAIVNFQLNENS